MSTNTDTADQTSGSSNTTLMFMLIVVVLGVVCYILIRYWRSLISEWRQHFNGGVPAQEPALGLSPSDIEAFPTFIYQGPTRNCNGNCDFTGNHNGHASDSNGVGNGTGMINSKRDGVSVDCSICLCDLQEGDVVRMLPECKHFFHIKCVDVWLYAHPSCPICRASLKTGASTLTSTDCTMASSLPHFHQCNNLQGSGEANIQSTTEEITTSRGITKIVVEQDTKMTENTNINSTRSTCNESIVVQIDVIDKVDLETLTEKCYR